MIIFEFDNETHVDGVLYSRTLYWLSATSVVGKDKEDQNEIYEQLDAQQVGLA